MNGLRTDDVVRAFSTGSPTARTDYSIVTVRGQAPSGTHFARARGGEPALLIPVQHVGSESTRLTQGLALHAAPALEFARGEDTWRAPGAVIECRDPNLVKTFAAMAVAILGRIDGDEPPTWEAVAALFSEWEQMLAHRGTLGAEPELGLWGELWCLSRTARLDVLLAAWRGPEAAHVDFLLDGNGFEIKASRRPGVHHVSQAQVDGKYGAVHTTFVSLFVAIDPLRGATLTELVDRLTTVATDICMLEEKLAATGYSHDDADSYVNRYALLEPPLFFSAEAIPRVRQADPGVSDLRYRVEVDRNRSLAGPELEAHLVTLGIEPRTMEFPCV